jgi:uncharacterized protein (DUF1778 family)
MTHCTKIEIRLSVADMELIEQAAQLLGLTVSEFASTHLSHLAKQTIQEHNIARLTNRDRDIFVAMLEADDEPNGALVAALVLRGAGSVMGTPSWAKADGAKSKRMLGETTMKTARKTGVCKRVMS